VKKIYCDLDKCLRCRRCELACYLKNAGAKDIFEAVKLTDPPVKNIDLIQVAGKALPFNCRQCDDPLCVAACISGALYIDEEKDCICFNKDKCVGCWSCIMRCPHGSICMFNGLASKCDNCDKKETPECVLACPTGALVIE